MPLYPNRWIPQPVDVCACKIQFAQPFISLFRQIVCRTSEVSSMFADRHLCPGKFAYKRGTMVSCFLMQSWCLPYRKAQFTPTLHRHVPWERRVSLQFRNVYKKYAFFPRVQKFELTGWLGSDLGSDFETLWVENNQLPPMLNSVNWKTNNYCIVIITYFYVTSCLTLDVLRCSIISGQTPNLMAELPETDYLGSSNHRI